MEEKKWGQVGRRLTSMYFYYGVSSISFEEESKISHFHVPFQEQWQIVAPLPPEPWSLTKDLQFLAMISRKNPTESCEYKCFITKILHEKWAWFMSMEHIVAFRHRYYRKGLTESLSSSGRIWFKAFGWILSTGISTRPVIKFASLPTSNQGCSEGNPPRSGRA